MIGVSVSAAQLGATVKNTVARMQLQTSSPMVLSLWVKTPFVGSSEPFTGATYQLFIAL